MKRLGGVVALALVVAGCGDAGLTEGAEGGDVTVTNHPALLFSPPWIAAQDQKLFEKHGLNVKQIVGSEGGGTTVRNVVSGGLPIGEVATTAADHRVHGRRGHPDRRRRRRVQQGHVLGHAARTRSWTRSRTSRARRSATRARARVTQGLLALSLERSGVGVDNVKTRSMGGLTEGLTALKNGDIDAAAILEPVYSEQVEEEGWKPVFKASDYVPEFLSTVIITGPGVLREGPRDGARRRSQARADGIEFLKRNPDAVAEAWAKEAEIEPEPARRRRSETVDPDEHWVVGLDSREALETVAEEMRLIDLLPGRPEDRLEPARRPGLHPARPADQAARRDRAAHRREREQDLRHVEAMRDVSLERRRGRVRLDRRAVSGCGKSTLMEIVGGLIAADRGHDHDRRHAGRRHRPRGRDRLPAGVGVPVAHGRRERRVRARDDRRRQGGAAARARGDDRAGRPEGLRGPLPDRALAAACASASRSPARS